jgi:hypothetical protein
MRIKDPLTIRTQDQLQRDECGLIEDGGHSRTEELRQHQKNVPLCCQQTAARWPLSLDSGNWPLPARRSVVVLSPQLVRIHLVAVGPESL